MGEFFAAWFIILLLNQAFIFGCFAPYCILAGMPHTAALAFLYVFFFVIPSKDGTSTDSTTERTPDKTKKGVEKTPEEIDAQKIVDDAKRAVKIKKAKEEVQKNLDGLRKNEEEADFLKQKGDLYEKFIGKEFEKKGELVIYNGFIRGYADDGVDVISISHSTKTIHLIQCKNWTKKPMLLDDVENIYAKLEDFKLDRITKNVNAVHGHLQLTKSLSDIETALKINKKDFTVRKTLYIGSDKVIDLNIGKQLKLIKPTIFRYQDMKIVIKGSA